MKKILFFTLCILMITGVTAKSQEDILKQYNEMGIEEMFGDIKENATWFDGAEIVKMLSTGKAFEPTKIMDFIVEIFLKNIKTLSKIFILLISLGYIISVMHSLGDSFGKGSSKIGFLVGYCVYAGVIVTVFLEIITPVRETIQSLILMIKTMIPTLLALLSFSGGVTTASLMSTLLITLINIISIVIGEFLINVVISTTALSIADKMSEQINISSAIKFSKQFVKWVILFCMAVYSGVYGVYGLAGTALDSRVGKAVRFAVGSSVPIVGGVVSESLEVILGTVGVLKSLTGVVGIIAICAVGVYPMIKTALTMWVLKLTAAILEPVSDKRLVALTTDIADSVSMIFAILVSVSLLLIGCIGVILISANLTS